LCDTGFENQNFTNSLALCHLGILQFFKVNFSTTITHTKPQISLVTKFDKLFTCLMSTSVYLVAFSVQSRMLMKKNVNNDVSKDSSNNECFDFLVDEFSELRHAIGSRFKGTVFRKKRTIISGNQGILLFDGQIVELAPQCNLFTTATLKTEESGRY